MVKRGDFMKKTLKVLFVLIVVIFICVSLYASINSWGNLDVLGSTSYPTDLKLQVLLFFVYYQSSIIISLVILYNLFKHSNILNLTKYTYEEYKQNKLNAKKEKLKKQLEEIEKTE
jgi:flagellar biosynthesis protein FlhB